MHRGIDGVKGPLREKWDVCPREGRNIIGLRIADQPDDGERPAVLLAAALHAKNGVRSLHAPVNTLNATGRTW